MRRMSEPTEGAFHGLLQQWGLADAPVQDSVTDTLRVLLEGKGLQPGQIALRWGVATVELPPHQAHLARLMVDDLNEQASAASGGEIQQVRIRGRLAPYPSTAQLSPTNEKDLHHGQ